MKDKDELENRQGAVLKIKCYAFYYGESGRNLPKHERATGKVMSTITLQKIMDVQTTILTGTLRNA